MVPSRARQSRTEIDLHRRVKESDPLIEYGSVDHISKTWPWPLHRSVGLFPDYFDCADLDNWLSEIFDMESKR